MFYTYSQNNSGGSFDIDHNAGLSVYVIVEADNTYAADDAANGIGIYFDEDYEIDCDCCGTRWSPAYDGDVVPSLYGTPVNEISEDSVSYRSSYASPQGYVHYQDGKVTSF